MAFTNVLLAVATVAAQDPAASPKRSRPVSAVAPVAVSALALEQAAAAIALAQPQLELLTLQAPRIAAAGAQLELLAPALHAYAPLAALELELAQGAVQDPGDSLYRAGRGALNRGQYARAAELFRGLRERYPRSDHAPNTYYWEAFALYRAGSEDGLRTARALLRSQAEQHPRATTRRDAEVLMRRVQGVLAQRGDAEAAAAIAEEVDNTGSGEGRSRGRERSAACEDEDDVRAAALNAMLQMDAERAVPILKNVLARRDANSTCLRRKAVFLVSQKRSPETSAILLDAVRNDPDQEVREQAVFWLSQVPGEEAVTALDSVLRASRDPEIQKKAIFALSQHRSSRAGASLRAYVERRDAPGELREQAIFWLGQHKSEENQAFLRNIYPRLETSELKEKVLFSVSQGRSAQNYRWLMDIALNQSEGIELRKKALFWASQGRTVDVADLVQLYDRTQDREMREQLIFVYSQRREAATLDKLFQIARSDPDRELRKKAIFWIGQSRDPRAAQFLQELINQ